MEMKRQLPIVLVIVAIFFASTGYGSRREHVISGKTMGTTYHIKMVTGVLGSTAGIKDKIDKRLLEINQSMSTYIKDSEISRFNAFERVGEPFAISEDFWKVIRVGQQLYELTQGAWDATVNPLVNRWGFGAAGKRGTFPTRKEIENLLQDVGFKNIELSADRYLVKHKASVSLDLGSIAKGYAVDEVARLIRENDIDHFLVEIGGEVLTSGLRIDGSPWRVGINTPRIDAPLNQVYRIVKLSNMALATSGNYRNYFIRDGIRYSHILDPRSGYPVANGVVSASVIADSCTFADGLATALVVLGPDKGIALVDRLAAVECMIVRENKDGSLRDYESKGFFFFTAEP